MNSSLWYCSPASVIGRKTVDFFSTWSTTEHLRLEDLAMLLLSTKRFACSLCIFIYIYVLDPGISETLIPSLKSVPKQQTTTVRSRGQCRYTRRASDPIAHSSLFSPAGSSSGDFGVSKWRSTYQKRLKITLTKGQKMCRNTASCLKSYIQYNTVCSTNKNNLYF